MKWSSALSLFLLSATATSTSAFHVARPTVPSTVTTSSTIATPLKAAGGAERAQQDEYYEGPFPCDDRDIK